MEEKTLSLTIITWIALCFLVMLLCGCSHSTPISDINDGIQNDVSELVDYANNNMVMDADKQLLLNGARQCAARANDMQKLCEEMVNSYKKETAGWKLATTLMSIIAGLLGFLWIKK